MSQDFLSQEEVDRLLKGVTAQFDWELEPNVLRVRGTNFHRVTLNQYGMTKFLRETYQEGEDFIHYRNDMMVTEEVLFMLILKFGPAGE